MMQSGIAALHPHGGVCDGVIPTILWMAVTIFKTEFFFFKTELRARISLNAGEEVFCILNRVPPTFIIHRKGSKTVTSGIHGYVTVSRFQPMTKLGQYVN